MKWSSQRVIVTGGAGFIGSNMVDALLDRGAEVVVVDKLQLTSGSLAWNRKLVRLEEIFKRHGIDRIPLEIIDLETDKQKFQLIAKDCDTVFHLSAVFGGREFVDTRQADCSKMLSIDHNVIDASYEAGVERLAYASSACFPAGTKVWTSDGSKNIEDLIEGDQLVDHLGKIGRVERAYSRLHEGTIRRIWISGFDNPIDATLEHPFLIETNGQTAWEPAARLEKGKRVLVPRVKMTGAPPVIDLRPAMDEREAAYVELQQLAGIGKEASVILMTARGIKDPRVRYYNWMKYGEKPRRLSSLDEFHPIVDIDADVSWLLGVYVAEGWTEGLGDKSSQIVIALGDEPELEARFVNIASTKLGLRVHRYSMKKQKGVKLAATHPLLAEWFAENFGTRARSKRIPKFIMNADDQTIRNFLSGYLEGDGCVSHRSDGRKPRASWATVSKELSSGLQILIARLGLSPSRKNRKPARSIQGRRVNAVESVQSYLDGWQSVELIRQLGLDKSLEVNDQKRQQIRKVINNDGEWMSRRIVKVKDIPFAGLVYNCEVSPNHSYCVGDGIAVHNCVYPDSLQKDPKYLLKESDILSTGEGWKSSDNLYGFAKLLGEMQCIVFHKEKGMKTSACRYLTVYGPGEYDTSHAISALIEKGLDRMDPYVVWGSGCLPPGGLVFAGGHYEKISRIKIGDTVEDHRGNFQLVLNSFKRHYDGEMYTIKGMGLKPFSLTPNHLVMVVKLGTTCKVGRPHYCKPNCFCMNYKIYHRHGHLDSDPSISVEWRRADELKRTVDSGEYLVFPKLKIQAEPALVKLGEYRSPKSNFRAELYNDIEIDSEFAFLLGWYTAEGWTTWSKNNRGKKSKGQISMALGPRERRIGLRLMKIAREKGFSPYIRARKPKNPKHKIVFEVGFSGTGLAKWIDSNIGKGAKKKRVPSVIFHAPEHVIRSYLKGLFMGDGSETPYGRRLTSTSAELLLGVQVLLSALNKFGCVVLPKENQSWGILEWSNEEYNKFWHDDENIYTPITSVSFDAYNGQVHDIETADHTFVAPVLVHNSQQRGFTYVTDIVKGSIMASEKITDGTAVNLGWDKRYTIKEVAEMILKITGLKPKMVFDKTKPEGPFSRALDISLVKKLVGWEPKVDLYEGLEKTIAWHKTLRAA